MRTPINKETHGIHHQVTLSLPPSVCYLLQVGWVKADTKAIQAIQEHVITHNPRISVSHSDQFTWNLPIKQVEAEDSGGYMCQVNTDPMKSQVRGGFGGFCPKGLFVT